MKGKLMAVTFFATIDAFFGGFAVGFNSRHALVADPSMCRPVSAEEKTKTNAARQAVASPVQAKTPAPSQIARKKKSSGKSASKTKKGKSKGTSSGARRAKKAKGGSASKKGK